MKWMPRKQQGEKRTPSAQNVEFVKATVAQNQGDQAGQNMGHRHHRFGDNHHRNLIKDLDNVEQVYNNPLTNIAERVKILRQNQDLSPQLR